MVGEQTSSLYRSQAFNLDQDLIFFNLIHVYGKKATGSCLYVLACKYLHITLGGFRALEAISFLSWYPDQELFIQIREDCYQMLGKIARFMANISSYIYVEAFSVDESDL